MIYVLDRSSGEILSVHAFVAVNATGGVDAASGTLRRNPAKATQVGMVDVMLMRDKIGPVFPPALRWQLQRIGRLAEPAGANRQ